MNLNKVKRLWREYNTLRSQRVHTSGDLQGFAQKLGRRRVARGKEPNWESGELPDLPPISIPFHGRNRSIAPKTARNILNDFEEDLFRLEMKYSEDEEFD